MAIKYTITKYGVSFPTKVAASAGSPHIYNITLTNDTPNGKIVEWKNCWSWRMAGT